MKKVFFAIVMLAAGIFSASAQDVATLSLGEDQTVISGTAVNVVVTIQTNFDINGFQFDVALPDAFAFEKKSNGKVQYQRGADISGVTELVFGVQYRPNTEQEFRCMGYLNVSDDEGDPANYVVSNTADGATIISFNVLTDGAAPGNYEIVASNITTTKKAGTTSVYADEVTLTVTIEEPTYYLAGDAAIMPVGTAGMPTSLEIDENGLTFTNIDHLLMGTYNYNVTVGNAEGATVYATGEPLEIESNGMYTIVYTFDEAAKTITAVATRVADATSLGELDAVSAEKLLIDGNVIIRRNGVDYTVTGQKL